MRITDKHVFFYTKDDFMSNFYYAPFKHKGILFKTSEHAVMYRKAMHFGAKNIADKILKVSAPFEAKRLGRSRTIPYNDTEWHKVREQVYFEVLLDKFSTPKLKAMLLNTGNRRLVEASPTDEIWGVGLAENSSLIDDERNWVGLNLLGNVLERVREELRKA